MNSTDPPTLTSDPEPAVPQPTMSLLARMLNVFAIPGDVFEEVRIAPRSAANWVVPALLFICVGWIAAWLILSQESIQQQVNESIDKTVQKDIDRGIVKPENAEQQREVRQMIVRVAGFTTPVFAGVLPTFGWGLVLWLLGTKLFKGDFKYMKAVEVCGLAGLIGVLDIVIRTLLAVGLSNPLATLSPATLMKHADRGTSTFVVLSLFNLMTFWVLAVRAIGLARLARVPFLKAAVWTMGVWLVLSSLIVGLGSLAQAAAPK